MSSDKRLVVLDVQDVVDEFSVVMASLGYKGVVPPTPEEILAHAPLFSRPALQAEAA